MTRIESLAFLCLVCLSAAPASAQRMTRASLGAGGVQGNADSFATALSADGRFVAFVSAADNLVSNDVNGSDDVFVRDLRLGTTARVSRNSIGLQGNNESGFPTISGDGRFVAFSSFADNLVAGDTNGTWDIFVHDVQTGTTVRASVDSFGAQGDDASWARPVISADGNFVAFESFATDLVAGDTNGAWDIFVRDLVNGTTVRASVHPAGQQGLRSSEDPSISADGRFVAFRSQARFSPLDTDLLMDVYVRDLVAGTTTLVSVDSSGVKGNQGGHAPWISGAGDKVVFYSHSTNLVPGDTNGIPDVFVHDFVSGSTTRVNLSSGGAECDGSTESILAISADGRFVAFASTATNLVSGDANSVADVFVRDLQRGATLLVSRPPFGQPGNDFSGMPALSADGRHIAFHSRASNQIAGDTNGVSDVFVLSLAGRALPR